MNLLKFCDVLDLNNKNGFNYINLHTRDFYKALNQCKKFFLTYKCVGADYYFYTYTSDYIVFGGAEYKLEKDNHGILWLIKTSFQGY